MSLTTSIILKFDLLAILRYLDVLSHQDIAKLVSLHDGTHPQLKLKIESLAGSFVFQPFISA